MLRLAYGPFVIRLDSAERAPLAWLREFLGVAFDEAAPDAPPHSTVRLELSPPPDGDFPDEVECFSLDGDFLRLPARRAADGSLAFRDGKEGILCTLKGRDVTIRAPADGPALRLVLLRVVRELATAHALRLGHLHLHAAAAEAGNGVIAIAGPRGSGKTTLLLHALIDRGTRYVTNDRLLVDVRGGLLARGMPTIVSLRDETLARFPAFARRLRESAYARDRTLAEAAASAAPPRPNLTPIQLRVLAGAGETGAGPLRAVVFPSVAPDVERFAVSALGERDAAAALRTGLFLATLPERPAAAFADDTPARDEAMLDRLCREVAARVPCLDVRLGAHAYAAPSAWDAIVERLP
jgi:hypothetical protein